MAQTMNKKAAQRLARDAKELQEDPIPGVAARPSEGNIQVWYVNMRDPYRAGNEKLHMHLVFPDDYPSSAPSVQLKTRIHGHPNVFYWDGEDPYVCLDMLKMHCVGPYQGWSSAYTVGAVLRQLYGFLVLDESIEQEYGGNRTRLRAAAAPSETSQRPCSCGFVEEPSYVTSESVTSESVTSESVTSESVTSDAKATAELPDDLLRKIVLSADHATTTKIMAAGSSAMRDEARLKIARQEQVCFHTRKAAGEDREIILGFPVLVTWHQDGNIKDVIIRTTLLSKQAFDAGVKNSAYNEPCNAFLPLALNDKHAKLALAALPACIPAFFPRQRSHLSQRRPTVSEDILTIVAKAMNTLVVEMCQSKYTQIKRHMSDNALLAFCSLHHLLLTIVCSEKSTLGGTVTSAVKSVTEFIRSREARDKKRCPDLGLLLIKLMLVPIEAAPWSAFAPVFLRELFARNVRFAAQQCPKILDVRDDDGEWRLRAQFENSLTSLRLVCIESFFANGLARPAKSTDELAQIKVSYDTRYGQPPLALFARFNEFARETLSMDKWTTFLGAMHLSIRQAPGYDNDPLTGAKKTLVNVLSQAVVDSDAAGYHRSNWRGAFPVYESWNVLPFVEHVKPW